MTVDKKDRPSFIAAAEWQGPKKGYLFSTREGSGTGYYWDVYAEKNPPKPRAKDKAESQRQRGRSTAPAGKENKPNRPRSLVPLRGGKENNKARPRSLNPNNRAPKLGASKPPSASDYGAVEVPTNQDDGAFYKAVLRCIPSEFVIIASQDSESQAQEDNEAMEHFGIKPPEGKPRWTLRERPGSVATCALMQMAQENPNCWVAGKNVKPYSTLDILQEIKDRIKTATKLDAHPTITASRPLGPPRFAEETYMPYYVVPPGYKGTRRALQIAVVGGGASGKPLGGTVNDVNLVNNFLISNCGFQSENITMLAELAAAPQETLPTKKNITDAFKKMVQESKAGDVNFIQFSGHGNRSDTNLYIMPSDCKENGYIQDERILKNLIKAMPKGVYTTFLVDCCYSGTIGDLPYILKADSVDQSIDGEFNLDIRKSQLNLMANQPSKTKNSGKRSMGKPQQSIRMFYDTDTLEETLAKEKSGGEEYQRLKKARKQKTQKQLGKQLGFDWKSAVNKFDDALDKSLVSATKGAKKVGTKMKRAVRGISPMPLVTRSKSKRDKEKAARDDDSSNNPASSNSLNTVTTRNSTSSKNGSDRSFDEDIPAPKKKISRSKSSTGTIPVPKKKISRSKSNTGAITPKTRNKSPVRKAKSTSDEAARGKSKVPVRQTKSDKQ